MPTRMLVCSCLSGNATIGAERAQAQKDAQASVDKGMAYCQLFIPPQNTHKIINTIMHHQYFPRFRFNGSECAYNCLVCGDNI